MLPAAGIILAGIFFRLYQLPGQILVDDEWHAVHKILVSGYQGIVTGFHSFNCPAFIPRNYREQGRYYFSMPAEHISPAYFLQPAGQAICLVHAALLLRGHGLLFLVDRQKEILVDCLRPERSAVCLVPPALTSFRSGAFPVCPSALRFSEGSGRRHQASFRGRNDIQCRSDDSASASFPGQSGSDFRKSREGDCHLVDT